MGLKTKSKGSSRRWKVHLSLESKKLGVSSSWIRKAVNAALSEVERDVALKEVCELHVAIINDEVMRGLNKEHRRKDKPTDVLSFPQFSPREISGKAKVTLPGSYLGDLVISSETTLRQAKEFGVSKKEEFVRLVVHGILHLCGYDHEKVPAAVAQRMRRRERYIRGKIAPSLD